MLPAANRLRTAADFRDTTRRGAKASRGCVVVYLRRTPDAEPPRVGLVVSKSVGGSVQRHRAARRIRGAIAPLLKDVPAGSCLVIRALPGADRAGSLAVDLAVSVASVRDRG